MTLPEWVTAADLAPAWQRIRVRFEQAGRQAQGAVAVPCPSRGERHALGELLGRTITRDAVRIDLVVLDARLRERVTPGGIDAVLTGLFGTEPVDRPAARAARVQARQAPLERAGELVTAPWADEWIAGLRRTGVLVALPDAVTSVTEAATVLNAVTGDMASGAAASWATAASSSSTASSRASRVELAARLLGDAHALDRDRPLHGIVLRGLAAASGVAVPTDARGIAELWARFGVEPDLVSRTCLVWRLRADGDGSLARRLDVAAAAGDPVHVTEWDLRRMASWRPEPRVLVCENPRTLESIAERDVQGWSVVCTSGEPNLVADAVVGGVVGAGAPVFIHGDFDWPGVAIVNRAIRRHGVRPLGMSATDYLAGVVASAPLLGGVVEEPSWDGELGTVMRERGRALHEESVLVGLLALLEEPAHPFVVG